MKKVIILIILALGIQHANAQMKSNLTFFTESGETFTVFLNGVEQNQTPLTNVKLKGLPEANYRAKIIFTDVNFNEINKTIMMEAGVDVDFIIKTKKNGEKVLRFFGEKETVYERTVYTESDYIINDDEVVYDEHRETEGGASFYVNDGHNESGGTVSVHIDDEHGDCVGDVNVNVNESGFNFNVNVNDDGHQSHETHVHETHVHEEHHSHNEIDHYVMPGYEGEIGCPWPMKPNTFQKAKFTIKDTDFENDKLMIAKQICKSNCLTTRQVKQIIGLFDFENTKLHFAKFAYERTYDIENYFIINDSFDFPASKRSLNSYINNLNGY